MAAKRFSIAQIAGMLKKHDGVIPRAAKELGTDRQALHARIARSPELQQAMRDIEDDLKAETQGAITSAIRAGDMATARWYAERKMRKEGYGTRIETAVDDAQIEAFLAGLGGNPKAYRAALAALEQSSRPEIPR